MLVGTHTPLIRLFCVETASPTMRAPSRTYIRSGTFPLEGQASAGRMGGGKHSYSFAQTHYTST